MNVCMHACMYVCMYVCMYTIRTCTYIHAYMHTYIHHTGTAKRIHGHMLVCNTAFACSIHQKTHPVSIFGCLYSRKHVCWDYKHIFTSDLHFLYPFCLCKILAHASMPQKHTDRHTYIHILKDLLLPRMPCDLSPEAHAPRSACLLR
jgi:hypothetical protein